MAKIPDYLEEILCGLPTNIDRRRGAEVITQHLFEVSPRTLEAWPLPTRHVNGRALVSTRVLLEAAYERFACAPVLMGGRKTPSFRRRRPSFAISEADVQRTA